MTKDRNDSPAAPDRDIVFVRALADILRENDLDELEVERRRKGTDRLVVRLTRNLPAVPDASIPVTSAAPVIATPPASPVERAPPDAVVGDPAGLPGAVISPMVGTVYLASEPGADPFVNLGDSVTEGQTLLIIEAMKTMNQIHAPASGVVKRIFVEDASPVEYGAPLMIVE